MKKISDYTIYCTPEQTIKAFELGAIKPKIELFTPYLKETPHTNIIIDDEDAILIIPTAEQMIGFILESGRGYSTDLSELIREQGYKQGCLTFIDSCLK